MQRRSVIAGKNLRPRLENIHEEDKCIFVEPCKRAEDKVEFQRVSDLLNIDCAEASLLVRGHD